MQRLHLKSQNIQIPLTTIELVGQFETHKLFNRLNPGLQSVHNVLLKQVLHCCGQFKQFPLLLNVPIGH